MSAQRTIAAAKAVLEENVNMLSASIYLELMLKVAELEVADEANSVEANKARSLSSFASSFSSKRFG